ncbi:MAG TPA: aminotransferase class I/II-fold pyridoxal phosphate-dependent enzyme [Firmicutes bacterium]|jgi:8-amino-7-oxononanoate synthase|nr:aminotransferase class I/II-fold pyridoxal phosphate-dependent enzyme [Bacillota bacterium]HOQ24192.1 aminotransferase class I/II-fold pyridoxal phosphate-dependent enzyme [Bacillota bacterium]HPT67647.1 aminotransferase class I/II-fold pyridoxal phosphate-dependent enzyme [Bacillota bacterium]
MDLFTKCHEFTAAKELSAIGLYPYFHELQTGQDTEVTMSHRENVLMIGSNNYLGLTSDPRVKQAAIDAVKKYGSGCSGSRFLNGTLDLHTQLEKELAEFMGFESALLFSTGFQSNLGIISAIASKGDYILCDRLNHASIYDGCRLSFAKTLKYEHNDMNDLERLLKNLGPDVGKLIVTDGVFSMEGDLANLPVICELARKYNARVMVDDAHGIGVLGKNGRGTAEYLGVEDQVDLIMGTFSKSFASLGGFVAAPEVVCHYIKHTSRPLIFSASMTPAAVASVLASLEIIRTEPERREHLSQLSQYFQAGLEKLGFKIKKGITPIVPVWVGDMNKTFLACKMLFDEGVYVNPVVAPAVPPDSTMIRTSLTATHTFAQLDRALVAFAKVGRALELIP